MERGGSEPFKSSSGGVAHIFHQPARSRGRPAYSDALCPFEPFGTEVGRIGDKMSALVDTATLVVKHFAIAAFCSGDEKNHVVAAGEVAEVVDAVSNLTANGVKRFKFHSGRYPSRNFAHHIGEALKRHCGLRVEGYVAGEVDARELFKILDYDCLAVCLPDETVDLCMACLSVDDYLGTWRRVVVGVLDALLQAQDHRTGRINDFDVPFAGKGVGRRGFSVGAQKHTRGGETAQILVGDCREAFALESFDLVAVMHDVAEAVERLVAALKFLLSFSNGSHDSVTEAGARVYFDDW